MLSILERTVRDLLAEAAKTSLAWQLWTVEPGRIRIHQDEGRHESH